MKEKIIRWFEKTIRWFKKNQAKIAVSFLLSGVLFLVCAFLKDDLYDFYTKTSGIFFSISIFFFPTVPENKNAFIKKFFIYLVMLGVIVFVGNSWLNLYNYKDSNSISYAVVAIGTVLIFAFIIDVFQSLFKGISFILQKVYKKLFGDYPNLVNAVEKITSAIVAITALIAAIIAFSQTIGLFQNSSS